MCGVITSKGEPTVTITHSAEHEQVEFHTNLVCMCCGHIQPLQRDQLPSRCENCRESFTAHGYFLEDYGTDAEELSQEVLDRRASLPVTGASR
jgi:Fe2+ or Zn2+ uptake regulation protein